MQFPIPRPRFNRNARRGIATLEFVMSLPLLLTLLVGLTWLGFSVIGQTEVLIGARNKAWKRRFENASDRPLRFPINGLGDNNFVYSRDADFVTERATKQVTVSPVFDHLPQPAESHTILAGSWDHRAMDFKTPPDLQLIGIAAATGRLGKGLDVVASADDPLGLIEALSGFEAAIPAKTTNPSGFLDNLAASNPGGGGGGTAPAAGTTQQSQNKAQQNLKDRKRQLIRRYRELGGWLVRRLNSEIVLPRSGDLKQAKDTIDALEDRKRELNPESQSEEIARAERELELADITYRRLEAEFKDVFEELEALDVNPYSL